MRRRDIVRGLACGALGAHPSLITAGVFSDVKVGMSTPANLENNGVYVWVRTCADGLEKAGMHVRIYHNSTIGSDRERTFQTQLGVLDINATGSDEVGRWSPLIAASARPFLISSYDHMSRLVADTPYLEQISTDLRPHGLELLDIAYTASMVGLFTRGHPVRRPADLQPLRLRVLSEADFNLLRAWNIRGVQVAWEEVAQGLQTGIIDAYLNPPNVAVMFGHGSVLDYFTELRMGPAFRLIVASTRWLDSLSADQQQALEGSVAAARHANRIWTDRIRTADRENVERLGIEWISISSDERAEWIEVSKRITPSHWENPAITKRYLQWVEDTRDAES